MENLIDLKKFSVRSDLAIESLQENHQKNVKVETFDGIKVSNIIVDEKLSLEIGKKSGYYTTIEFEDITDFDHRERVGKIFAAELKKLLKIKQIEEEMSCLIIGLGNEKSTPDALGPKTIHDILVTRYLFKMNAPVKKGIRSVAAFTPDVMGNTGMETSEIIQNIVKSIQPHFLLVIDALASSSIQRVTHTIQMTDTGIQPGSGVGNHREEISENVLKIPVIAIGIPTVVDAVTIVSDSLTSLLNHISYLKENLDKSKLSFKQPKSTSDHLSSNEKKELMGMIGIMNEEEKKQLLTEVLMSEDHNLMVTPKEIDFLIEKLSSLLSSAINNTLHQEVDHY